jgi:hypothetical protein
LRCAGGEGPECEVEELSFVDIRSASELPFDPFHLGARSSEWTAGPASPALRASQPVEQCDERRGREAAADEERGIDAAF